MIDLSKRLIEAKSVAENLLQSKKFSFCGLTPSMLEYV